MPFAIFSARPNYYKNGLWWFTKMMAVAVGEHRWEAMNIFRRVYSNKFYYVNAPPIHFYSLQFSPGSNSFMKSSLSGLS